MKKNSDKKEPEYLKKCAYKGCENEGRIYKDMLFPIMLCDDHSRARFENVRKAKK